MIGVDSDKEGEGGDREAGTIPDLDDGEAPILMMVRDKYGNYIVQKIIEVANEEQKSLLEKRLRPHIEQLKKITYGKHIVNCLRRKKMMLDVIDGPGNTNYKGTWGGPGSDRAPEQARTVSPKADA